MFVGAIELVILVIVHLLFLKFSPSRKAIAICFYTEILFVN